jgi:hypothetical protein
MRRRIHSSPRGPFTAFLESIGVTSLTPAQRALVRVAFDGIEPYQLAPLEREAAREIFGDVDVIPPVARGVLALVKGARVGGTWLCALRLLYLAWTIDLSTLAYGERGYAVIIAPDLRLARQALRYVVGAVDHTPYLATHVIERNAEAITLKRPDGATVTIEAIAASRGGVAGRGRTLVGALLDESMFLRDSDFVVCDTDVYMAITPRLLGDAQALVISTPWVRAGLLYGLYDSNRGTCATAIAAHLSTPLARAGDPSIAMMLEREKARDLENYHREYLGQFVDGISSAITADELARLVMHGVSEAPWREGLHYGCFIDVGLRRDRSCAIIVHRELAARGDQVDDVLVVDAVAHLVPTPTQPLVLEDVVDEFAALARRYRVHRAWSDMHYFDAIGPMLKDRGIDLEELPMSAPEISARVESCLARFASGTMRIIDHVELRREIVEAKIERHAGGRITWKAIEGAKRHDDCIACLQLAHTVEVQRKYLIPAGGDVEVTYSPLYWRPQLKSFDGGEARYSRRTENGSFVPAEPPAGSTAHAHWFLERVETGEFTPSMVRYARAHGVELKPQMSDDEWQRLDLPLMHDTLTVPILTD